MVVKLEQESFWNSFIDRAEHKFLIIYAKNVK